MKLYHFPERVPVSMQSMPEGRHYIGHLCGGYRQSSDLMQSLCHESHPTPRIHPQSCGAVPVATRG